MIGLTQEYLDTILKNLSTKKGFDNLQDQWGGINKKLDVSEQIKIFEKEFKKLEEKYVPNNWTWKSRKKIRSYQA